jgi:hypothetical protein
MQPGQQPPQGFQWDSAGQQQTSSAPQMLQGAPNMLQGAPQQLMGNNAYGQQQMMMQQPSTNATAALVISLLSLVGGFPNRASIFTRPDIPSHGKQRFENDINASRPF